MAFEPIDIDIIDPEKNKESKRRMLEFIGIREFEKMFSNNDKILSMIFSARLSKSNGLCPCCDRKLVDYQKVKNKPAYRCACGNRVYPLKGTPLEGCRTPLKMLLTIIYEVLCSKHGLTATEIVRKKYVRKYKTAQRILRSLSELMGMRVMKEPFPDATGVEVDQVHIAVTTEDGREAGEKRTQCVYTMVCRETGLVKIYLVEVDNSATARRLFELNFNSTHTIYTDDATIYKPLRVDYEIHSTNHSKKEYARRELIRELHKEIKIHSNTNENFNRSLKVSTHRVHNGVSQIYLDGYCYRMAFIRAFAKYNSKECVEKLLEGMPPLFINGRIEERKYIAPSWEWTQAA